MELIRKEKPDLVILDWMMPEISGIEVCRQLKEDKELVAELKEDGERLRVIN